MRTLEEFHEYFESTVKVGLSALEERRIEMREKQMRTAGVAVLVIFVHWIFIYFGWLPWWSILISLAVAPPVSYLVFKRYYFDPDIPTDFKQTILHNLVSFIDSGLSYEMDNFVPYEDFAAAGLYMLRPDHYTGDDYVSGSIGEVSVRLSEVHATYTPPEPSVRAKAMQLLRRPYEEHKTIFHGFFAVAQLPESFKGRVFVFSNTLQRDLGYLGRLVQQHDFRRGKYIHPQNPKFADEFVVYADHLREGDRLLTGDFMERLLAFRHRSGVSVRIAVLGDQMYVAADLRRKMFEVSTYRSLLSKKYVNRFFYDFFLIILIIQALLGQQIEDAPPPDFGSFTPPPSRDMEDDAPDDEAGPSPWARVTELAQGIGEQARNLGQMGAKLKGLFRRGGGDD